MRCLVVEDNPKLAALLGRLLTEQAHTVDIVHCGMDAERKALEEEYDLIVLDLMLPDCDGRRLCADLRRRRVQTPVLMLTALSSTSDKVSGLDAGADEYLTKPFDIDEFVARVRALLRRAQPTESAMLKYGDVEMDLLKRTVRRNGHGVSLTTKEFALLEYLLRHPEHVLSKTQIGNHVWNLPLEDASNVVEVYVSRLRAKMDKGFDTPLIHTIIGAGYMLNVAQPQV
jgi:DNA-binding response OmpR family regulator